MRLQQLLSLRRSSQQNGTPNLLKIPVPHPDPVKMASFAPQQKHLTFAPSPAAFSYAITPQDPNVRFDHAIG